MKVDLMIWRSKLTGMLDESDAGLRKGSEHREQSTQMQTSLRIAYYWNLSIEKGAKSTSLLFLTFRFSAFFCKPSSSSSVRSEHSQMADYIDDLGSLPLDDGPRSLNTGSHAGLADTSDVGVRPEGMQVRVEDDEEGAEGEVDEDGDGDEGEGGDNDEGDTTIADKLPGDTANGNEGEQQEEDEDEEGDEDDDDDEEDDEEDEDERGDDDRPRKKVGNHSTKPCTMHLPSFLGHSHFMQIFRATGYYDAKLTRMAYRYGDFEATSMSISKSKSTKMKRTRTMRLAKLVSR